MIKIFIYIGFTIYFIACSSKQSSLDTALLFAGENRQELEDVLSHYSINKEDSLKYKAAVFLISNMPGHISFQSNGISHYLDYADSLYSCNHNNSGVILDSVSCYNINKKQISVIQDIHEITAGYLISNIDNAFENFKYPWCHNLNFSDFCEYILPYKYDQEMVENWREDIQHLYMSDLDSIAANYTSIDDIGEYICYDKSRAVYNSKYFRPQLPPSVLSILTSGSCLDYCMRDLYRLRSCGVAVAIDYVPQWPHRAGRHSWNVYITSHKDSLYTISPIKSFEKPSSNKKISKVYRKCYSFQNESLVAQKHQEDIPPIFSSPFIKDVTLSYVPDAITFTIDLEMSDCSKNKYIYLMVFDNTKWAPVAWGQRKGAKGIFHDVGKNCAYITMFYENNEFIPASYPFTINKYGFLEKLIPNKENYEQINAYRKYSTTLIDTYKHNIVGGQFQGANNIKFDDAETLYMINSVPTMRKHIIDVKSVTTYKYYRFISSIENCCEIAEVEFYSLEGKKLNGKIIGSESLNNKNKGLKRAFDNKSLTYYRSKTESSGWVGIELHTKQIISKVGYTPRNDDNFIRKDYDYELLYWDNEWIHISTLKGEVDGGYLTFNNIPTNSLLLLKCLTTGNEERIFSYENNSQIWW